MLKTVALDTNSEQTHHEPLLVLGTVDAALDGVYTYQVRSTAIDCLIHPIVL